MESIFTLLTEKAKHSDCPRAHCAVVAITNDDVPDEIFGVNHHVGETSGCVLEDNHCVNAIHAEVAMVTEAAKKGIPLKNAIVFSLERPCQRCLVTMREAGVKQITYFKDYHSKAHGDSFVSPTLMQELNVTLWQQ